MTPFIKGFPFLKTPKTGVFLHSFSFFITTNYKDICQSTSKSTSSFLALTQKMNNGPPNFVRIFLSQKKQDDYIQRGPQVEQAAIPGQSIEELLFAVPEDEPDQTGLWILE